MEKVIERNIHNPLSRLTSPRLPSDFRYRLPLYTIDLRLCKPIDQLSNKDPTRHVVVLLEFCQLNMTNPDMLIRSSSIILPPLWRFNPAFYSKDIAHRMVHQKAFRVFSNKIRKNERKKKFSSQNKFGRFFVFCFDNNHE
jgi:hypothetical protein